MLRRSAPHTPQNSVATIDDAPYLDLSTVCPQFNPIAKSKPNQTILVPAPAPSRTLEWEQHYLVEIFMDSGKALIVRDIDGNAARFSNGSSQPEPAGTVERLPEPTWTIQTSDGKTVIISVEPGGTMSLMQEALGGNYHTIAVFGRVNPDGIIHPDEWIESATFFPDHNTFAFVTSEGRVPIYTLDQFTLIDDKPYMTPQPTGTGFFMPSSSSPTLMSLPLPIGRANWGRHVQDINSTSQSP